MHLPRIVARYETQTKPPFLAASNFAINGR
jgi:hypothetical protein